MQFVRQVNEGSSITESLTFDDFGYTAFNVFDWDATPVFSGDALKNTDYTVSYPINGDFITITVVAIDDNQVENIENAIAFVSGYIEWIDTSNQNGSFYENVLGQMVEGTLETEFISGSVKVEINSKPIGNDDEFVYFGSATDTSDWNVLDNDEDGSNDTLSVVPQTKSINGVSVQILSDGSMNLSGNASEFVTHNIEYTVKDELGAESTANAKIDFAKLNFNTNLNSMIELVEGRDVPKFNFSLSHAVDANIDISVALSPNEYADDITLLEHTIAEGETTLNKAFFEVLDDKVLEHIEAGTITLSASYNGQNVKIFDSQGIGSTNPTYDLFLTDKYVAGDTDSDLDRAKKLVTDVLGASTAAILDLGKLGPDSAGDLAKVQAYGNALQKISVGVDAALLVNGFVQRKQAYDSIANETVRASAEYDNYKKTVVDGAVLAIEAGIVVFGEAAIVAAAAQSLTVALTLTALPVAIPALGLAVVGFGLGYGFNEYAKPIIEAGLGSLIDSVYSKQQHVGPDVISEFSTGNDTVQGTPEVETFKLDSGDDTLDTGGGDDSVSAGDGNDTVEAPSGNVTVLGGRGNDKISLKEIPVFIHGGSGNDSISFKGASQAVEANLEKATVSISGQNALMYSIENAEGGAGDDVIVGSDGSNVLIGEAGDDDLQGGDGNDKLFGGADSDVLNGGSGNDKLYGNTGVDDIFGGSGADIAYGGHNNDRMYGGNGNDALYGENGNDILRGNDGNDRLVGGEGNDRIFGGDGDDILKGQGGEDKLYGEAGSDILFADADADELYGGADNDFLYGGRSDDHLSGGNGGDRLRGNLNDDTLNGNNGDDLLFGGGQNDTLNGETGNDNLDGENGNDFINGGSGDDVLRGGAGIDIFIFENGNERDRVRDWENGIDKLDLSDFNYTTVAEALTNFYQVGASVRFYAVDFSPDILIIENTQLVDITETDLII